MIGGISKFGSTQGEKYFGSTGQKYGGTAAQLGAAAGTGGLSLLVKGSGEDLMFQDVGARPDLPGYEQFKYQGITSGGQLQDPYSLRKAGMGEFQTRLADMARSQGPTEYANLQEQLQRQQQAKMMGQQAGLQAGQRAQSMAALASRGGVTSGARERLASQAGIQGALGRQQILGTGAEQRLGIQAGDIQRKLGLQADFATQEEERARTDIQRAIEDQRLGQQYAFHNLQGLNEFNLGRYKADIAEWGASKEAAMQEKLAATKGGLFGSGGMLGTGFKFGI